MRDAPCVSSAQADKLFLLWQIIMSKKPLITTLAPYLSSDPGLLHTTLSSLPPFLVSSSLNQSPTSPSPPPPTTPTAPTSDDDSSPSSPDHPPLPLPDLFALTTRLLAAHPPFDPTSKGGLGVEQVMGPRSVVFTYEEEWTAKADSDAEAAPSERVEEAERVVGSLGEMVNLEYVEEIDSEDEVEESEKGEKRKGIVRKATTEARRELVTGVPNWALGVAVLVVVGAVGVGVWGGGGAGKGSRGWRGWVEGFTPPALGVWEWFEGVGRS